MPESRWLVFDTSVYVTALRQGLSSSAFDRLQMAAPRTYLASVVSGELRAGALDATGRRVLLELADRFERLGRVITPTARSWNDAGDILAKIARRELAPRERIRSLWNDALIALSARQIGATVVTENLRDFRLLRRYARFELEPSL